jgi:hypothetical protein
MAEYEATAGMPAESTVVFGVVSDIETMDRWLPRGLWVRDSGPARVEAGGELLDAGTGHEGLIRTSPEQLRVEWGGRDHPGYAGWLQVSDTGAGASEITVHISLLDEPAPAARHREAEIQPMLEDSLERLANEVTRRVSAAG